MRRNCRPHVASHPKHAYLSAMAARLLISMLLFALVLMPLRMAAEAHVPAPAPASEAMSAMAEHCGGETPPDQDQHPRSQADCMMACAALPGVGQMLERLPASACPTEPTPLVRIDGRQQAADPPPPRFS